MVIDRIILDTNVVSAILKKNTDVVSKLVDYNFCIPTIVIGELLFGAYNSARITQNTTDILKFIDANDVLTVTQKVAEKYGQVRNQLKKTGRPIPENDIWIAAICLAYELPLATLDGHFKYVEGIELFL